MAKLRKTELKKLTLPTYEDEPEADRAVVELETPARMSDFDDVEASMTQVEQTASILVKKIKSWNLTGDDDKPLPITIQNVIDLDAIDFGFLSIQLGLHRLQRLTTQKKMT